MQSSASCICTDDQLFAFAEASGIAFPLTVVEMVSVYVFPGATGCFFDSDTDSLPVALQDSITVDPCVSVSTREMLSSELVEVYRA